MPRRGVFASREEGQASVELALLLPIIVLVVLMVLEIGLTGRDIVRVTHASREAARAAATDAAPDAARRAAIASSGLDPDRLEVTVMGRAGPGSRVKVTIAYDLPTSIPLVGALLGHRRLRSTATMRVE